MRSNVVIPEAEDIQFPLERIAGGTEQAFRLPLQGPEKAFDPAVLPRATDLGALVFNPAYPQAEPEQEGGEDRFIVGA